MSGYGNEFQNRILKIIFNYSAIVVGFGKTDNYYRVQLKIPIVFLITHFNKIWQKS